jgi:hypothetical protein
VIYLVFILTVFTWVSLTLYASERAKHPAIPEYCQHDRERIPITITLVTGPLRIAWWCPVCGKTTYLLRWITKGEGETPADDLTIQYTDKNVR